MLSCVLSIQFCSISHCLILSVSCVQTTLSCFLNYEFVQSMPLLQENSFLVSKSDLVALNLFHVPLHQGLAGAVESVILDSAESCLGGNGGSSSSSGFDSRSGIGSSSSFFFILPF